MLYCERTLPLQIHLQVCEALKIFAVNENLQSSLLNFDRDKLTSIMDFIRQSDRLPPNLTWLRKRLEQFGQYLDEQNLGSAPFRFGNKGDFWANMPEEAKPYERKYYFE